MGETQEILALWRRARARGERVCLATVARVEGSSYRKPGARMLVTESGERAGTISGGCLEAEVSRKCWWLSGRGPVVERYQSSFDEDDAGEGGPSWGLGCGGTVWVLLEQEPADVLAALERSVERGEASVILSRLEAPAGSEVPARATLEALPDRLGTAAAKALRERRSSHLSGWFVEYLAPPPRLTIFGAGDDAVPIALFAEALGWRIAVADGRSHLLRPGRFPASAKLRLLAYSDPASPLTCGPAAPTHSLPSVETGTAPGELAVVLTHSYDQDRALAAALLPRELLYLGILGPRHRTARLVEEIAPQLGWTVNACFARLHAPVGLDLGARDPATIALAIVAEMQAALAGRTVTAARTAEEPEPLAAAHG